MLLHGKIRQDGGSASAVSAPDDAPATLLVRSSTARYGGRG